MKKTTVYLPDDLREKLARIAERENISAAELTRKFLQESAEKHEPTTPENWLENFPVFFSGDTRPYAERDEEILKEGFGEW